MIANPAEDLLGGGRAHIRLRTGAESLGDLGSHLDDARRLGHGECLRVGVGDDEIDPLQPGGDHVVDGVAARAADAEYGDSGLQLADVRGGKIECHGCLSITRALDCPGRRPRELVNAEGGGKDSSEALAKPSSDLSKVAVSPCPELPRMPRFDVFKMNVLRIDQQPGWNREGGALGLARQPAEAERTAKPHRPAQHLAGKFGKTAELRGSAAQDDPRLWFCGKWGIRQAVPDHLKYLLGPVPNDVRDRGTRHDLWNIPLTVAGGRHRHQFTRV